ILDLPQHHPDRLQHVERLEPRHHQRTMIVARDEFVGTGADNHADMTGPEETVEGELRRIENGLDRRDDSDVVAKQGEVANFLSLGLQHSQSGGWHCCFEAKAEEHHLPTWVGAGKAQGIERGIHHTNIGALRLGLHQALARARHTHGVAEGREDYTGRLGNGDTVVDTTHWQHTYRTAGAVDQLDLLRQHGLDAIAENRMGVSAANFHDLERPTAADVNLLDKMLNAVDQRLRLGRVTKFVDVFHQPLRVSAWPPACRDRPPEAC